MSDIRKGKRGAYRDYDKNGDPVKKKANPKGFWDKSGKYRSGRTRKERQRKRCGAKKRTDGQPCQRWAMDNGRCRLHGGKAVNGGAPKGSQNRLSTGEKETIWHTLLTDEENLFVDELKLDAESLLNEELRLITVRQRRMMQRIAKLAEVDFTTVRKAVEQEQGVGKSGAIDLTKIAEESESTLGQIQKIEEALTRVQEKKAKLLDLKLKVQEMQEGDDGAIEDLVTVLQTSRRRLGKQKHNATERFFVEKPDDEDEESEIDG